ncbi:ABC transporter permease [Evansella cellulosilytica]|uniref:ABC3 transporter permease protein domain-containing protein n=1 Tax=Evansella cellulosilytica (strain ATCC 21833 / DSM 2522 / FERM P-1141 / JCM 9156 / N-4) TaxID=649639 RepID=E6TVJ7_EVAC2|nr:ABC transporter permease [Evansella cellulosilytica]ADU31014.1 protein of unknown function DUF214 [Evansella cellulosilytica DSM 2522]
MNFIRRAIQSVIVRKGKNLLLFLILFFIYNLVLTSLAIQSSVQQINMDTRESIGNEVILEFNNAANTDVNEAPVNVEEATSLKTNDLVTAYNYKSAVPSIAEGFSPVSHTESTENDGDSIEEHFEQPNIYIEALLFSEYAQGFERELETLIDGRHITDEDEKNNVVVIEKNLAIHNDLEVGDTLSLKPLHENTSHPFEIVGIYETKQRPDPNHPFFSLDMSSPYNKIYIPYTEARYFDDRLTEGLVWEVVFYLKSGKYIDQFIEDARAESPVDFGLFHMYASDDLFSYITGAIGNVASFSTIMLYIVTGAGAMIICLIIMISLKERTKEIGILFSLGESRLKIIGQILSEVIIIAIIAFSLSVVSGQAISQSIANYLLDRELTVEEEVPLMEQNMLITESIERHDELNVQLSLPIIITYAFSSLFIICIAIIIPAFMLLRYEPRSILIKHD